mmetsp:Transcript_20540/g.30857  ORF Transcript_20540/g.30857 Transcript_20540/m.30857 type:complete len:109 (+) Transcript_20540:595-921(+)
MNIQWHQIFDEQQQQHRKATNKEKTKVLASNSCSLICFMVIFISFFTPNAHKFKTLKQENKNLTTQPHPKKYQFSINQFQHDHPICPKKQPHRCHEPPSKPSPCRRFK